MSKSEFNPQWVAGARKRDQGAITDLYNFCYQSVYLTTKSLIKSDEDTVLDILQDSFIKALTSLDQLGDDEKFPVWIKAIARNKSLDWLRRNQKIRFQSIDNEDDNETELQFEDDHIEFMPEIQMDQKETARLIREILDSLSDGQKMAVSMFYYQDMSIQEIAQAVGCSVGTIKAQLHTGRKKIEEKVRELEKNGTKLYGLMPFPFFGLLLRNMNDIPIQPNTEQIANLLNNIGIGAATGHMAQQTAASAAESAARTSASQSTGTQAAHATAKMAGTTAVHTAKGKVIAGILAVAVLGGAGSVAYVNHKSDVPDTNSAISVSNQDAADDLQPASNELEAYHDLLHEMQDDGSFLQYAHMEDLNGDGTDELMVLHDNTQFTVYALNEKLDTPEAVINEEYEQGFVNFEGNEFMMDETFEEATRSPIEPFLRIQYDVKHSALLISKSTMEQRVYSVVNCQTWKTADYVEVYDEANDDLYAMCNGEAIDYDEFMSVTESDDDYEFADQLSEILAGELLQKESTNNISIPEEVKESYATLLRDHMNQYPEYSDTAVFQLIYVDDDDIPELAIADQSSWGSGVALYTYIDGHTQLLGEKLGSNGTVYYKDRENIILSKINKDTGDAYEYMIDNGVLIPLRHSTLKMDSDGYISYTIDGEEVSTEEGKELWDSTVYTSAGADSEDNFVLNEQTIGQVFE